MTSFHRDDNSEKTRANAITPDLSSAVVTKVQEVCAQFEECWKRGESPKVEDWLSRFAPQERPVIFYWLLRVELEMRRAAEDLTKLVG